MTDPQPPPAWRASTPFVEARPQGLVVCCSDGRWHRQFEEFIRADLPERCDVYAIPGGAAVYDAWSSSFEEARAAELSTRFLVAHHAIRDAWLISHEGCAYYRQRRPFDTAAQLAARQRSDLRKARDAFRRTSPQVRVRLLHAALDGTAVVIAEIEDAGIGDGT